jgi:tRNA/tmRNA/rRNA uracil-C5-methylase (TrmA/RlmC/RlmD family)
MQYQSLLNIIIELLRNSSGGGGSSSVDITGNSIGLATSTDIASIVTALAELPNVEINTEAINLNVQDLELLLTTVRNQQTDGTQTSKITDGTDTLAIRTGGQIDIWNKLPFGADRFTQSNPDINGNYQTIIYRNGATIVRTITLAFDVNNVVTSYIES